ncbi:MAG: glycoside hydrolase N-terminal domain-containing protein [Arcanobacterium sp.]|nr:glycoside hydrolase N-terminal domain-containing protein [Arcanobacterium sp.]
MRFTKNSLPKRALAVGLVATLTATGSAAMLTTTGTPSAFAVPEAQIPEIQKEMRLWYDKPASQIQLILAKGNGQCDNRWQQATLPIGNGDLGATVYGEIGREQLLLNEKTLWTGGPGSTPNYNGGNAEDRGQNGATIRRVQQLFEEGRDSEAATYGTQNLTGGHNRSAEYGGYQALGNLFIDTGLQSGENYQRSLNLETGLAQVSFDNNGTKYSREYFSSNPDGVIAGKLNAENGTVNATFSLPSLQNKTRNGETTTVTNNTISVTGRLNNNQLIYNAQLKIMTDGGNITASGNTLRVQDADSVTFFLSAATDYKNVHPHYRTGEDVPSVEARVANKINSAATLGYDFVKARHITDFSAQMEAMTLNLGGNDGGLPTDQLLAGYKNNSASAQQKRHLETVLHAYGRYLLVSSSRANSQLPANLQGVWAACSNDINGENPWRADYHMNVNLQMNYWPAYSGNTVDSALPLIEYVKSLVAPGRVTARVYAGTTGAPGTGFMAHTENTPYGWTTPGHDFSWGWSPAAVPWILQNVYEHYEFTSDIGKLRNDIYPLLKESTTLYIEKLLHKSTDIYGEKRLVSSPTYSPEHGPTTDGNVYEQVLIWQLLHDTIKSAQTLNIDGNLVGNEEQCAVENWDRNWANNGTFTSNNANRSWSCALSLLKPVVVGNSGQIKEWYNEGELGKTNTGARIPGFQSQHRHLSHLLGLFPGDLITTDRPTYMDAAVVTLNERGANSTGWGLAQRLASWARTGNGNKAHELIVSLMNQGMYPNLFDAHPPFQIDGNFGYTAGVNEMLLQSNASFEAADGQQYENYMNLLPSVPDAWGYGSVAGLRARGNFEVAMKWSNKELNALQITSNAGNQATLAFPEASLIAIKDDLGRAVNFTVLDEDHITFPTEAGRTYIFAGFLTLQSSISVDNNLINPDTTARVTVTLENIGETTLNDVIVSAPARTAGWIIEPRTQTVEEIPAGQSRDVSFEIRTDWAIGQKTFDFTIKSGPFIRKLQASIAAGCTGEALQPTAHSVSSEHTTWEPTGKEKAVDGNPETHWHSEWTATFPHWITVELPEKTEICGYVYTARTIGGNKNGRVKRYEISISDDGTNWSEPVAVGEFTISATPQVVPMDVSAKYVRLTGLSAHEPGPTNMTVAEIQLLERPTPRPTAVIPVEPSWDDEASTYTVTPVEGVIYSIDGVDITSSEPVVVAAPAEVTIEARAVSGFYIPDEAPISWTHSFTVQDNEPIVDDPAHPGTENPTEPDTPGEPENPGEPANPNDPDPQDPQDPTKPVLKLASDSSAVDSNSGLLSVAQGEDLTITLSGIPEGTKTASFAVYSDPVNLGSFTVNDGIASTTWNIPKDFPTGEHTVVATGNFGELRDSFLVTASDTANPADNTGTVTNPDTGTGTETDTNPGTTTSPGTAVTPDSETNTNTGANSKTDAKAKITESLVGSGNNDKVEAGKTNTAESPTKTSKSGLAITGTAATTLLIISSALLIIGLGLAALQRRKEN